MNSHALGNSGRSLPRPSPELCSGHVCSPQAGRAGAQLLCTGGSPRQAGLSSSHGGGEWAPRVPAKHSQPVSERAKRQGQECLVPKQVLGMAGLFCHETWWRGETQQREKGAPRGRGQEGELLPASQRGRCHVPDPGRAIACRTGLLSSPHQLPLHLQDPLREPEPPTALRPAAQVTNRSEPQDMGGGERMEPHADAKFKKEPQGHSDKCGTQHKSIQMTGEKQNQMDRPPRPARPPQACSAQVACSCRLAGSTPTTDATPLAWNTVSTLPQTLPRVLRRR